MSVSLYPAPANADLLNDPTPKDQAIYVPSVTPAYALFVHSGKMRPLPTGVKRWHLNFLAPDNNLFRISHVMSSAGQALNKRRSCMITERRRASTFMIGDSGGYQVASGNLAINSQADVRRIMLWSEAHADVAMTLDVPTGPIGTPLYGLKTYNDCLNDTLGYLDYYERHRTPGKMRFLNVLQGNTKAQSDDWYEQVRKYQFEGWAVAGKLRQNMHLMCRRLLKMADKHDLEGRDWIHVLGTANLETAVLLTAVQRALNGYKYNEKLRISFDTSTPFRMMGYRTLYTFPKFDRHRMSMSSLKLPDDGKLIGSPLPWPWPSPLGDRMTLGDFCVATAKPDVFLDQQSSYYLAHHNLATLCFGIATANKVFDAQIAATKPLVGEFVCDAVAAIDEVLRTGSMATLSKKKPIFERLRHGVEPEDHDEDRSFKDYV